ncbi:alpha-E domain-containing protein [Marinobacter qingdaonensis]|uniref:Alpha-E domain-containing protein n=1 Tax=Marinobacter qingdaonensis TaxID=3108486 RepID=A0ABU5NX73_9GAMM|nr:alpha-E domain-containing protein [Marinobacter sp. ASW11-75]MEA1080337.1 alpha-E domain-containing protein [Marinobacter sp. ASW11-75]MEE2764498.1 alpha-E domain-containing protein [Pseudomonadota bacterium]
MLSRVAERLYWMARYLERAENNARMIMAFNSLALDMPRDARLSWKGLVAVTGMGGLFDQHYQKADERNCVKFLVADSYNPSSIASCLRAARENVRTTRDQVPTDAWEVINELYRFVRDHVDSGISKRARYEFLAEIVSCCQTLTGLLAGCMSHDAGYEFIRVGRNLERADMATRQIEVGALQFLDGWDGSETYGGLLWTSVLRYQSAFQMYRHNVRRRVNGPSVIRFLLQNEPFPRSVLHSLNEVAGSLERLPRNEIPLRTALQAVRHTRDADVDTLIRKGEGIAFLETLQLEIGELHEDICETWFPVYETV